MVLYGSGSGSVWHSPISHNSNFFQLFFSNARLLVILHLKNSHFKIHFLKKKYYHEVFTGSYPNHFHDLIMQFNLPKCVVAALLMVEGLFSLLFCFEICINQYARQKTLIDIFGASLLFLEFSCFRNIVLPYHLTMLLHAFMIR